MIQPGESHVLQLSMQKINQKKILQLHNSKPQLHQR